jgi:hypothetical protein
MWVRFTDELNNEELPEAFFGINGAIRGNSTGGTTVMRHTDDKLRWQIWIGATEYNLYSDNPLALDTNYHVACDWDGANLRLFLGGVLQDKVAATGTFATEYYQIPFVGWMSTGSFPGRELLLTPPHMRIGGFRFGPRSWRDEDTSFTPPVTSYTLTSLEVIWNPIDANVIQTSSDGSMTPDMYRFDLYEQDGYLQHHRTTAPNSYGCAVIGGTIIGQQGGVVGIGTVDVIGARRVVIDGLKGTNVSHGPWFWNNSFFAKIRNVELVGGSGGTHICRDGYTLGNACGVSSIVDCEAYGFSSGLVVQYSGLTLSNVFLNNPHRVGYLFNQIADMVGESVACTSEESVGVPDYYLHIVNPAGSIALNLDFNTIPDDTIPVAVQGESSSYDESLIRLSGLIAANEVRPEYITYTNPTEGKTLIDITDLLITPILGPVSLTPQRLIQRTGKNQFAQPVFTDKVTTTDATETTVLTIPIVDESVNSFGVRFVGEDQTNGDILIRELTFIVKRQAAGAATQIGTDSVMIDEVPTDWDAFHEESGNNVLLKVIGDATNDVNWTVVAYQTVTALY